MALIVDARNFICVVGSVDARIATAANLKKVFGVEGAGSLDESKFQEENVDIAFGKPEGGKVKIKATPKDPTAKQFFMRVKMKQ